MIITLETIRFVSALALVAASASSAIVWAAELTPTHWSHWWIEFWAVYGIAWAVLFLVVTDIVFGG